MLNPFKEVNWHPDVAVRRVFAKSLMLGFPCLAVFFLLAGRLKTGAWHPAFALQLGGFGAGAGALFYAVPAIARLFYVVWYGLACALGFVVGNVLMTLLFYVVVTGTGLLKRGLGGPTIRKTFDRQAATYWHDAPPARPPASYFKQF